MNSTHHSAELALTDKKNVLITVDARDPVVSRDGRPFGENQGFRMRSAGWPLPSMVVGSLRTLLGKLNGGHFSEADIVDLKATEFAGLLPMAGGQLYFPAPRDCQLRSSTDDKSETDGTAKTVVDRLAPRDFCGGADWPVTGLLPVLPLDDKAHTAEKNKGHHAPAWWPAQKFVEWLCQSGAPQTTPVANDFFCTTPPFLRAPECEERMHVRMDADSGSAQDSHLFSTSALLLGQLKVYASGPSRAANSTDKPHQATSNREPECVPIQLSGRLRSSGWCLDKAQQLNTLHPMGGERRLVRWSHTHSTAVYGWDAPEQLRTALKGARRVRMVLVTPAIFASGWKPDWLDHELCGTPPNLSQQLPLLKLKLVGASTERWKAISGWSLEAGKQGPKAIRRMVPAGGVYFFEVLEGDAQALAERWLESTCTAQDGRDGFGLAAWGVW